MRVLSDLLNSLSVLSNSLARESDLPRAPVQPRADRSADAAIDAIRVCMQAQLADCRRGKHESLIRQLYRTRSAQGVWMLRCELYYCLSVEHGELVARQRINSLLPMFKGLIAPAQLRPI